MSGSACNSSCPPTALSVSDSLVTVLSKDGTLSQGEVCGPCKPICFDTLKLDCLVPGCVVDVVSTNTRSYLLTNEGRVFELDSSQPDCPRVKELCIPQCNCKRDPVVQLKAGTTHVVMLTKHKKVYGYGDNTSYQLVPQGECTYNYPVPIIITDKIVMDQCTSSNSNCYVFQGTFVQPTSPTVPVDCNAGGGSACTFAGAITGSYTLSVSGTYNDGANHTVTSQSVPVTVSIPVFGNGTICGNQFNGTILFSGSATVTLTSSPTAISYGSPSGFFDVNGVTASLTASYTTLIGSSVSAYVTDNCGVSVNVCASVTFSAASASQPFTLGPNEGNGTFALTSAINSQTSVCSNISVVCPENRCDDALKLPIPQPCWANVYAGKNGTALVDTLGRIYVLGSLSGVRDNNSLLENNCLDNLLSGTKATLKFPADELKCPKYSKQCGCPSACGHPPSLQCTDLSKFNVELELTPNLVKNTVTDCGVSSDVYSIQNTTNVCDFLKKLKLCNETPNCDNVCTPCDNVINVRYGSSCSQDCPTVTAPILLLNHKSVSNVLAWMNNPAISSSNLDDLFSLLSQSNVPPIVSEFLNFDYAAGRVEFNNCEYFTDTSSICASQVVVLNPSGSSYYGSGSRPSSYFVIYVDIECDPRAIVMTQADPTKQCFNVNQILPTYGSNFSSPNYLPHSHFAINYGGILGSVELINLQAALGNFSYQVSPQYKNPITNKVYLTYVQPTDYIILDVPTGSSLKMNGTYDVPLVFNLNKRVTDLTIYDQSISILLNYNSCPAEVFALGQNCSGNLGVGDKRNRLCFTNVNRCFFGGQVCRLWSSKCITVYETVCGNLYSAGQRCDVVNSSVPVPLECASNVRTVALNCRNLVLLTRSGCVQNYCPKKVHHPKPCARPSQPWESEKHVRRECSPLCNLPPVHPVLQRYARNLPGPLNSWAGGAGSIWAGGSRCRCVGGKSGCRGGCQENK